MEREHTVMGHNVMYVKGKGGTGITNRGTTAHNAVRNTVTEKQNSRKLQNAE